MIRTSIGILCLFLLLHASVYGNSEISKLEQKLTTVSGHERIQILNKLAEKFEYKAPEKTVEYGEQALTLAERLHDVHGYAAALRNIGNGQRVLGQYEQALKQHQQSLHLFQQLKDTKEIAKSYLANGIDYRNIGNYDEALKNCRQAVGLFYQVDSKKGIAQSLNNLGMIFDEISKFDSALVNYRNAQSQFEALGDKKGIASCINNIGIVNIYLGNYDNALEAFLKGLKMNEQQGDSLNIAHSLNYIGTLYAYTQKHELSLEYYLKSLSFYEKVNDQKSIGIALNNIGTAHDELGNFQESLNYYLKSLVIMEKSGDKKGMSRSYGNIGNAWFKLKNNVKALEYYRKSLQIDYELDDQYSIATTLLNIGDHYRLMKNYDKAIRNLNEALKISEKLGAKKLIQDCRHILSDIYETNQNYKLALEHYKAYTAIKDSIQNRESSDKIAELQTQYETEKKEQEIALLSKNNEIQRLKLSKEKFKINSLIVVFVLALLIFMLLFRNYWYLLAFWKKKNYIGQYQIEDQIGSGGMGIVYRAHHLRKRNKTVAIKVIRDEISADPMQRKRFIHEASIVDQIDHPNIVKVIERGEYNQRLYIAMELLNGRSLSDIIENEPQLPFHTIYTIMNQLTDILRKIHSKGIIHRDLKPENIMLVNQNNTSDIVKLLDFGVAKADTLTKLTMTGEIVGSINYLPPEQISNRDVTAASDIYSLGVIFYELLTREKPFLGETPIDVIKQILEKDPVAPSTYRNEIPESIDTLILSMMSKKPDGRPSEDILRQALSVVGSVEL